MPYYWTMSKGPCACCGACGFGFLMMDAVVTNLGASSMNRLYSTYRYDGSLSTMNGLVISTKFTRWGFIGFARRVQAGTTKKVFRFSHSCYTSGMRSDDSLETSGVLTTLGIVDGLTDTQYQYMDLTTNPTIAEITWVISLFCDTKTHTEARDYFHLHYDEILSNYISGGFIEI